MIVYFRLFFENLLGQTRETHKNPRFWPGTSCTCSRNADGTLWHSVIESEKNVKFTYEEREGVCVCVCVCVFVCDGVASRLTPNRCFTPVCFTPFRFNAPCQFTSLHDLRSHFRFNAFRLAAFCYANLLFMMGISSFICVGFFGNAARA